MTATILEAKTRLSELVRKAQAGEDVIITSGRQKTPVARISPVEPRKIQRLRLPETPRFVLGKAFWEPMSDAECGYGEDVPG